MLYYFSLNVILLSVGCYITFGRMLYYFRSDVILLSDGSYITSLRMLLYFLQKVEVFLRESRGVFPSGSLKRIETGQLKGE